MPRNPEPSQPIDAYKAIIDQLVGDTRRGGAGFHIMDKGIFSKGRRSDRRIH
jgi:hypothetical protein